LSGAEPDRKPRKADIAYEELRRQIVSLELEPGASIDEQQLIERLEIGRTPVREAIQRLIYEGLIVHYPRKGSWVAPLSFTDLQNLIEARRMMELECARLATLRMTPARLQELRDEIDRSSSAIQADDIGGLVAIDQNFHVGVARATDNRYLIRMSEQLHHELNRYWYVSAMRVGELHIVERHHRAILDALGSGDPDEAERVMDEHVTLFRERLSAFVSGSQLTATGVSAALDRDAFEDD
jgi:GntR family transcriptional regulator, rspAB operon transcriptional repressor